jgi:hypothetical protein
VIEASTTLAGWQPVATNTLPASGTLRINDTNSPAFATRYYRAGRMP